MQKPTNKESERFLGLAYSEVAIIKKVKLDYLERNWVWIDKT